MKIKYWESDHGFEVSLIPETPKEVAELARLAMNKLEVAPEINLYMGNEPSASIWIKKMEKSKQRTAITKKS